MGRDRNATYDHADGVDTVRATEVDRATGTVACCVAR